MKLSVKKIINTLKNPSSGWQTSFLVLVAASGYLVRAGQYLFRPQLFAEDGVLWLAEGHNKSITALFQPVNGFLHFPERLFGYVVARVSLHYAPHIFVLTAWILFILLIYYLLSSRTKIFVNNFERIFIVLALALVANIPELFFNFSNSVFLMGIIGSLIMIASKPKNRLLEIFEKTFFLLTCLTLPFAWFFLPIALVERFKYKRKELYFLITSFVASVVQIIYYVASHVNRSPITFLSLWSKWTLLELYNQMLVPGIRFARIDILVQDYTIHRYPVFFVFFVILLFFITTCIVIKKSNKQVRYLLFFLAAMTFASVKSPTLSVKTPIEALKTMAVIVGGSRYFVYGVVGVIVVYVKATKLAFVPRARYLFMIGLIGFGLLTSLHYQDFFIEKQFMNFTTQYNNGITEFKSGHKKSVNILVNPSPWNMTLTR